MIIKHLKLSLVCSMNIMIGVLSALSFTSFVNAREVIQTFKSTIQVNTDATLEVTEIITIESEGRAFKHGIVREFPTRYQGKSGTQASVNFTLLNVTHNNKQVDYRIEDHINGIAIYIGSKEVRIAPGIHTYTLTYKTDWQIYFGAEHDELYWNVTGNGWRLPIMSAWATVILPHDVAPAAIQTAGYTGVQGSKNAYFTVQPIDSRRWLFKTTQQLLPGAGFTIALGWPKGLIKEPTQGERIKHFIVDNLLLLWVILCLFILGILYIYAFIRTRQLRHPNVIIPEFFPPEGYAPSAVRYLYSKNADSQSLSADIINLAVKGYLTITYSKGMIFGGTYTLTKADMHNETPLEYKNSSVNNHISLQEQAIFDELFKEGDIFTLQESNRSATQRLMNNHNRLLSKYYNDYFVVMPPLVWYMVFVTLGMIIFSIFIGSMTTILSSSVLAGALIGNALGIISLMIVPHYLWLYTPDGQRNADHIAGFKMFLSATETERLNFMGAPDRTPEQYEKYLPYAMALGVEKPWSRQFAPVFARLAQEGVAVTPLWYIGPRGTLFDAGALNSSFNNSLSSYSRPISSSTTIPGSSSGLGGRGSSGGGGGGGGGGGW